MSPLDIPEDGAVGPVTNTCLLPILAELVAVPVKFPTNVVALTVPVNVGLSTTDKVFPTSEIGASTV